jgi:hypothetical protein
VMLALLRRRVREQHPEWTTTTSPAAALHRGHDMLTAIWTMVGDAGAHHPTWKVVEALLRLVQEHLAAGRVDREPPT